MGFSSRTGGETSIADKILSKIIGGTLVIGGIPGLIWISLAESEQEKLKAFLGYHVKRFMIFAILLIMTAMMVEFTKRIRSKFAKKQKATVAPIQDKNDGINEPILTPLGLFKKIFKTATVGLISFLIFGALGAAIPQMAPQWFGLSADVKHSGIETFFRLCCFFAIPLLCSVMTWYRYPNQIGPNKSGELDTKAQENIKTEDVHSIPNVELNVDWDSKDPYALLGILSSASAIEIKNKYHNLISQYHPDKVSNLGPELRKMADEKTKLLNWAYNECLKDKAS